MYQKENRSSYCLLVRSQPVTVAAKKSSLYSAK